MKLALRTVLTTGVLLVTTACGGGGGGSTDQVDEPRDATSSATPSETPTSETPTEPPTSTVEVVVVYNNFLNQSCEALSGIYRGLHNGSRLVIETETGEIVGEGRLGDPPIKVPNSLCAWGAKVDAAVEPGVDYRARAATRFTSKLLDGGQFDSKRLIINANS